MAEPPNALTEMLWAGRLRGCTRRVIPGGKMRELMTQSRPSRRKWTMRMAGPAIVLGALVGLAVVASAPPVWGAGADSSHVVAALRVLEQYYFTPVDPTYLLNGAIAGLRKATNLESGLLPDIPTGLPEALAVSTFQQRFTQATQSNKKPEIDLAYQATREMLASLHDGDTYFMDPAELAEQKKRSAGAAPWVGIGVTIRSEKDAVGIEWIFVEDVYPGSPAQSAGLRRFDRIVSVDGKPLRNLTISEILQLLRGQPGSTASLVIQRGSAKLDISAIRAPIRLLPRVQMIRPGVAYVRIFYFSEGTGEQVRSALRSLAPQSAIRGVVLDLRGNGGGYLSEIQSVAGVFLPSQTVVAHVIRHAGTSALVATGELLFPSVPMSVLSDNATVGGALMMGLRTERRATIIGERSEGIGGSGVDFPLPTGGMHITVEMVVGPHSEPLQGVGVTPDSEVALTEADMERGVDTQLDVALKSVGG